MTVFLLWTFTTLCSREGVARLIFADLTTNRFTRSLDGTLGMWSYHGIAKESKASQTRFIFNGDLIDEDLFHQGISFHPDIATTSIPYLGLTSDSDVDYLLYQILQAKTAGIDGFMVEWGFKAHPSDRTLKRILHVLERYRTWVHGFKIGINWCDHWLTMHLRNSSLEEVLLSFKTNLQYLIDSVYSPFFDFTLTYSGRPVIFLFGGGLTVDLFKDLQMQPLKLPGYLNRPIWIGNYLNTGSSACLRRQWSVLLNGTFAWVSHSHNTNASFLPQWDTYTLPGDAASYQRNVFQLALTMLRNHLWCWWALSATPGEDNRGCAGWGQTLKFIPRVWLKTNTYDVQWKFNIESSPDIILIATFNDFSEATVILPTRNYGFTAMKSTAKYASWWKGQPANIRWLSQPSEWFLMMKDVDFLAKTKELNVTELYHYLEETLKLMLEGCYSNARNFLKFVRTRITHFKAKLTIKYLRAFLPSHQLYFVKPPTILNQGYLIDHFHKLYIQLNKTISTLLQKNNYRGMLTFDYKPLRDNHLVLLVRSSCSRSEEGTLFASFSPYSLQRGDYSIICELWSEKEKGQWLHAAVELYKDNQAWDQSGPYSSDLTFHVGHVNSSFLVTNVTLWVNVHQFTEI